MKNALRVAALVGIIVMSWFATARPSYAFWEECSTKDGSACTSQGASSKCSYTDESSQCYYIYPCWCEPTLVGSLQWRCGTTWIYEGCSASTTNTELGHGPAKGCDADLPTLAQTDRAKADKQTER